MPKFMLAVVLLCFVAGCDQSGQSDSTSTPSAPPATHAATPPASPSSPPAESPSAGASTPDKPSTPAGPNFGGRTEPFKFKVVWVENDAAPGVPPEYFEFNQLSSNLAKSSVRDANWLDPTKKTTITVSFGKSEVLTLTDVRTDPETIAIALEWKKGTPTDQFIRKANLDSAEQIMAIYEAYLANDGALTTMIEWE